MSCIENHDDLCLVYKIMMIYVLYITDDDIRFSSTDLYSNDYHLIAANLKNINELEHKFTECGVDKTLPTLFIAECVLVYIEKSDTDNLFNWLTKNFPTVLLIYYEQVGCL